MKWYRNYVEKMKKNGKKGAALVMVVGMTTIALTLVTTFVALAFSSMNNTIMEMRYTQAQMTAKSVLESFCSNLGTKEGKGIMDQVIPALDTHDSYSLYFDSGNVEEESGNDLGNIGQGKLTFTKEQGVYYLSTQSTYKGVTASVKASLGQKSINTGNTVTEEIGKIYKNTVHNSGFPYGSVGNLGLVDFSGDLFLRTDLMDSDTTIDTQSIILGSKCRYNHSACRDIASKIGLDLSKANVHHGNLTVQFGTDNPFNNLYGFFQNIVLAKEAGKGGSGSVAVNGSIEVENSVAIAGDMYATGSVYIGGSGNVYVGGTMVVGGTLNIVGSNTGSFPDGSNINDPSSWTLDLYVNGDLYMPSMLEEVGLCANNVYVAGKVNNPEYIHANNIVIGSRSPEELKTVETKLKSYLGYTTDKNGVEHVGYGRVSGNAPGDMFYLPNPATGVHTRGSIENQYFKYTKAPLWYSPDDTSTNKDYTIEQGCSSFDSNQEGYYGMAAGTLNKPAEITLKGSKSYAITSSGYIDQSYIDKYATTQNYANIAKICEPTLFIDATANDVHLKLASNLYFSDVNLAITGTHKVYMYAEKHKVVVNTAYSKKVIDNKIYANKPITVGQVYDESGNELDVWSDDSPTKPSLFISSPYESSDCISTVYTDENSPRDRINDENFRRNLSHFRNGAIIEVNSRSKFCGYVFAPLREIIVSERKTLTGWEDVYSVSKNDTTKTRTKIIGSFAVKEFKGQRNPDGGDDLKGSYETGYDGLALFRNGVLGGCYLMKYVEPDTTTILFNQQQLDSSGSSGDVGGGGGSSSSTDTIWGIGSYV